MGWKVRAPNHVLHQMAQKWKALCVVLTSWWVRAASEGHGVDGNGIDKILGDFFGVCVLVCLGQAGVEASHSLVPIHNV